MKYRIAVLDWKKYIGILLLVSVFFVSISPHKALAFANPAAVPLGTVDNFGALAKTSITSPTGPTVINDGDLGIDSPGTCTDFPSPCSAPNVNGTINNGAIQFQNAAALTGQTDATAAVTNMGLRTSDQTLLPQLGGQTLTQGVYDVPAAVTNLTGDLTLSGDASSVFILRMASTLITDSGSRVLLSGGVQSCNVFWEVDSSATFNGTTEMVGTVLAAASITFPGGGGTLDGRAIAQAAAITFNNTTVNNSSCATPTVSPTSGGSGGGGDSDNGNGSGENSVERCVAVAPEVPQWTSRQQVDGGVNLTWSAMGGNLVDIEIANAQGEFEFRYTGVPNDGHMFLPNVTAGQAIRMRVVNVCEEGEWVIVTGSPRLPNAGFTPTYYERAVSWFKSISSFFSSY